MLAGLRPLLVPSRLDDPIEKVGFVDEKWVKVPGGGAVAEVGDGAIYLAISLRNAGSGIAVLDRWKVYPERLAGEAAGQPDPADFRRLTRDLYLPPSDRGFWQGALRDGSEPMFERLRTVIEARGPFTIDLLYGDYEGGQRMISRFGIMPRGTDGWIAASSRHWNLDRPAPR